MQGLTIAARNYLPQVQIVARSFLEHHRRHRFATLLIDGDEHDRAIANIGEVLLPDDLGLDRSELHTMAAMYSVMELSTALKPAAMRHLLRSNPDLPAVMYLDPDIVVMAPLDDVFAAGAEHGIALTPHVLEPMPRDGHTPDEEVIRHAGIFNLGFLCVGRSGLAMLDWWHERLRVDGAVDLPRAQFTDQRWIDWVPALFPNTVLRDPGLNVAYWNLHERALTQLPDGTIYAGGSPLRFFHYSGFDPRQPWSLSKHHGPNPRVRIHGDPVLSSLTERYATLLDEAGFGGPQPSYRLGISAGGLLLTPSVRMAIRARVLEARPFPDPFDPAATDDFRTWLTTPAPGRRFTEWELHLHAMRSDLTAAFPDLEGAHAEAYRNWLDSDAGSDRNLIGLDPAPVTPNRLPADSRDPLGWNLVGYLHAELGVGEAGRRLHHAVERCGRPVHAVSLEAGGSRHEHRWLARTDPYLRFADSVYCVNADQTPRITSMLEHAGARHGDARRYGVWFWEIEHFPPDFMPAFRLLDEVWATSEYSKAVIESVAPIPVRMVPLPVTAPPRPTTHTRFSLGLPEGFLFTFSFDFNSVMQRKNPLDTVSAYTRAFGPHDGTRLILKSMNGHRFPDQLDRVLHAISSRPDVHLIDAYWDAHQLQGLIELSDCFVSLHRCEGFGLHLADAMAAGRPVIATGYSGNMTFMSPDSAFLVPYELVPIGPHNHPYPSHAQWAQPNLDAAADLMRAVVNDPLRTAAVAEAGRRHVLDRQSIERTLAAIEPLIDRSGISNRRHSLRSA